MFQYYLFYHGLLKVREVMNDKGKATFIMQVNNFGDIIFVPLLFSEYPPVYISLSQ